MTIFKKGDKVKFKPGIFELNSTQRAKASIPHDLGRFKDYIGDASKRKNIYDTIFVVDESVQERTASKHNILLLGYNWWVNHNCIDLHHEDWLDALTVVPVSV